MAWRGLALVVVIAAGAFAAVMEPWLILQGFVLVSFALLGVFAALLLRRSTRPEAVALGAARVASGLRELRRVAVSVRPQTFGFPKRTPQPVSSPRPRERKAGPPQDDQAGARQLIQRLAPPASETGDNLEPLSQREMLAELLREAEDLRSLGRLLKLDLTGYAGQVAQGLQAAQAGRLDECILSVQFANTRLRAYVQGALVKALPSFRANLALRRR